MAASALIREAAGVLRSGGLVAFPTETVYGLGASATDPHAVRRIFAAKGRPTSHPLILHIDSSERLGELSLEVPARAWLLIERFWPGPLTLVVKKSERVSAAVTGGQDSVAVRVPDHPLALALLSEFGAAVAAPSANRFGGVSPTTAEHVRRDLGDEVDLVLDGGPASIGIESTIVDVTRGTAVVLRLGGVSVEALEAVLGEAVRRESTGPLRVPGQLQSHYAPRAEVLVVGPDELAPRVEALRQRGAGVSVLVPDGTRIPDGVKSRTVPADPEGYARSLYAGLRELDATGADILLIVPPRPTGIGEAVIDRLERAQAPRP